MNSKEKLLDMLYAMLKIRRVEERISDAFAQGKIPGFLHVSIGQEAVSAGVCACLHDDDSILTTHRGHGQALAKGIDLKRFMAEIYGRVDGFCKGKSGSMHIASRESGVIGSNGIVGAGLPISLGTAFASAYRGEKTVTVCFFGDGASNQGTFHESLNLAALWNLPVVYCCENNGWAQFTPGKVATKLKNISKRAESYGMPGVTVDGDDVLEVRKEAAIAVERARNGEGPTLLECMTHRWFGHYVGDAQKYRSPAEVQEARTFDPIVKFRKFLSGANLIGAGYMDTLEERVRLEIDEAVAFAEASPVAGAEELFTDVYA
ncbi:MAG TPA: pyruvate dehydrogenase (acetyl-transferring) E1 component subunit alpha [Syntrophus sp. (in: bacteria)]|jgi:TPP-dependent pyruvate/acetoin dehydrogenase alpha subunit|nr:pyruvate dehydrogenase (acetyl-transferring) E1 component subunit alpha [Syntrophus sp. (in: bacteria)]